MATWQAMSMEYNTIPIDTSEQVVSEGHLSTDPHGGSATEEMMIRYDSASPVIPQRYERLSPPLES